MNELISLIPLPVALGVVLYTNKALKEHKEECDYPKIIASRLDGIEKGITEMHQDIRELRK